MRRPRSAARVAAFHNAWRTSVTLSEGTRKNVVADLLNRAAGGKLGTNGPSYEVLGRVRSIKVTQSFLVAYALQFHPAMKGTIPGPSAFWLLHDANDAGKNIIWDAPDDHGAYGDSTASSLKDPDPDAKIGEGFFWARIPAGKKPVVTTVENPAETSSSLKVFLNEQEAAGSTEPIPAGKVVRLRTPLATDGASVRIRYSGAKTLVLLETKFE